jgi:hypothetical protein
MLVDIVSKCLQEVVSLEEINLSETPKGDD